MNSFSVSTGIMSSGAYLCDILEISKTDFLGISEHWLYRTDEYYLGIINWHKKNDSRVVLLNVDDDRIIGIRFLVNTNTYLY